MSNKRANVKKIFKCSICAKADYKEVVPGAVTFFNRCTFTPNCAGTLSVDPNADITSRSDLTWRQTPMVHKSSFTSARILTLSHNFGHIGSLVVEVFVDAMTLSGITRVKTTSFKVVSQTADTVVVDLLTPQTGTIVLTDNQFNPPSTAVVATTWSSPNLLTSNIITIAADIEVASFTTILSYKTLTSLDIQTESLTFINHYQSPTWAPTTPIGGTIWTNYKVIALEKPYFLYSAIIPTYILQKGNSLQLSESSPTMILPMATSQKTISTDIVQDKIVRNSTVRLGDLVVDNSQLVVANSSIIEELRKPFVIY